MSIVSIRNSASAFVLAAGLAATGAAADTLQDAFAMAYQTNPDLISARASLRATDENVPIARSGMRPNVSGSLLGELQDTSINGAPSGDNSDRWAAAVRADQVLYDGGRTYNSVAGAIADVNAGRQRLTSLEQSVLLGVVTAYENVRRDQRFVEISQNNIRVITEQLRAARDRFDVGEVTRTDVSQAEARLAEAQADLAAAEGSLARSLQSYRRVVGSYPGKLEPPPPLPPLPETLQEAVQMAMDANPDIRAAQFDEESARRDIKVAQGVLLPTVSITGQVSYSEGGPGITNGTTNASIQARVDVPIYQGGAEYAGVRQAQAAQSAAMSNIHSASRAVREAVENAWSDLQVARVAIRATIAQVEAQQRAFDGVREEATLGARTTIDVLDAEQDLLQASFAKISSERDAYVAGYTLVAAIGQLTVMAQSVDVAPYDPGVNYNNVNDKLIGFEENELTTWERPYRP